nr:hypothetical protein [Tanacetum cinerariifolium]
MIPELGDANRDITVTENFHLQTDDELSDKELKQIEADDQAIQTILLGLPEDIYVAVDSCKTAQEIWLRVQQMMKGSDIGIQEKKAKLFNEWERFTSNEGESIESYYHRFLNLMNDLKRNKHFPEKIDSNLRFLNNLQPEWSRHVDELKAERVAKTQDPLALMANSNNPYAFPAPHQDQSSFNQNYLQQPMPNPEDITDPTTAMNMALALMAKAFKLNYSTPTNNNQRILSNPMNRQIAQPGNPAGYNDVIGNQNQIGNGNLVAVRAEGNAAGQNGNQIRCADNRLPMLEKDMYDSWKSRMELYMLNRTHGRMILESVEQGPLIWPSVEVEGVTRLKKYLELSAAEAIQADCDVKATNIILQGLPPKVYALVSTHKVAKELWEHI